MSSDVTETSTAETAPAAPGDASPVRSTKSVLGLLGALAGLVLVAILVIVLVSVDWSSSPEGAGASLADGIDSDRIQAVFLTDGTVYFGKVRSGGAEWVVLKDARFLRTAEGDAAKDASDTEAPSTQLAPVSTRPEGGTGDLRINANEITLVEDLATKSPISRAFQGGS